MSEEVPEPPSLETGWDATTPADDTIVRQAVCAMASDIASLAKTTSARAIATDDFVAADLGTAGDYSNIAVLLRPMTPETAGDVIGQITGFYNVDRRKGFAGIFSVWPALGFREFGWNLGGYPPLHFLPAGSAPLPAPEGIVVRPATSLSDLHGIIECANTAYGSHADPEIVVTEQSLHDPRRRYWLAEQNGRVVGGASSWLGDQITYVSLMATHPDFRRRGIGKVLTSRASLIQPGLPASLLSTDEGRLLYDQMGFLRLMRFSFWFRHREGSAPTHLIDERAQSARSGVGP